MLGGLHAIACGGRAVWRVCRGRVRHARPTHLIRAHAAAYQRLYVTRVPLSVRLQLIGECARIPGRPGASDRGDAAQLIVAGCVALIPFLFLVAYYRAYTGCANNRTPLRGDGGAGLKHARYV